MIHVTMSHRLLIGVGMKKGEEILMVMKNDLYTANERIKKLEKELRESANCINSLVGTGYITHHPSVEIDAMTDGMLFVANGGDENAR